MFALAAAGPRGARPSFPAGDLVPGARSCAGGVGGGGAGAPCMRVCLGERCDESRWCLFDGRYLFVWCSVIMRLWAMLFFACIRFQTQGKLPCTSWVALVKILVVVGPKYCNITQITFVITAR